MHAAETGDFPARLGGSEDALGFTVFPRGLRCQLEIRWKKRGDVCRDIVHGGGSYQVTKPR